MRTLQKYLGWIFGFTALLCLQITFLPVLTFQRQGTLLTRGHLLVAVVFTGLAAVFGMAWWTGFKRKRAAKGWGIAASVINVLVSVIPAMFVSRFPSGEFGILLAIGVAGLVAFSLPYETPNSAAGTRKSVPIAGDGTNDLFNQIAEPLIFAVCFGVYLWWIGWLRTKGVPGGRSTWWQTVLALLVVLIITTCHELGHTATGLALGMKLRAFVIGPFQWRIRDGRWDFQFKPKEILALNGGTGVVPSNAHFSRGSYLCMVAAGPSVNLIAGVLALWIAFAAKGSSPIQAGGACALFGAWSLALCAANLVPFRNNENYSDGAVIYQLLSHGPWGDFQRVIAVIGSSLVTPLRPRDYDIQAILRAGHRITQGAQGMFLRLYAYTYFLDQGRMVEAGEALRGAESIHQQSASDIPAELHTVFVFGSAYVRRDAVAAREWWTRMESKKSSRFNADFWIANSALQWIEGNLKQANEAWEKSNAFAQQLPKAGAYEFDRYCCSLLRKALDEASARTRSTLAQ
jgi:Peptidase family M50